jgi:hypothetical protein
LGILRLGIDLPWIDGGGKEKRDRTSFYRVEATSHLSKNDVLIVKARITTLLDITYPAVTQPCSHTEGVFSGDRECTRGKEREVPCFRKTVLVLYKKVILLAPRYKKVILLAPRYKKVTLLAHFVVSGKAF